MEKKPLYHHCFEMSAIGENDLVPVGGGMIGSPDMPYKVRADFENIYPRLAKIAETVRPQLETPEWKSFFEKTCPEIPVDLAITLQTFTDTYESKRRKQDTNTFNRSALYQKAENNCVPLSEIFAQDKAMCVEVSVLAKRYLDDNGIKSRLFSGEFMPDLNDKGIHFTEAHTFLIITYEGEDYIYDPTRPTFAKGDRALFSLYKPCADLSALEGAMKQDCLMVGADNVLTKSREYYGVGDGGNIPQNLIVSAAAPMEP